MEAIFNKELNQEENEVINEVIHQQLFYHLLNLTCALIINLSNRDIDLKNILIQVVHSDEMWIKRNHSYYKNDLAFSCRCQAFLILCEECDKLRNLIENIEDELKFTDSGLRFNRRHYIVMTINGSFRVLNDVFNSTVLKYIPYFLVINFGVQNVTYYTHDFRSNVVELSGDSELFSLGLPEVFRVATDSFIPYSDAVLGIGSEMELCRQYANRYKMEFFLGGVGEYFGTVEFYDNSSEVANSTGLHDGLLTDKYDTIFGAFLSVPEEYAIYDFSYPSTLYGCTCLVPIPKILESWFSILNLFAPITWFLFFITFVLLSVLSAVAVRNEEMEKMCFISYSIFIMQPVNPNILIQAKRFFVWSLALAVLHQCVFSSRLSITLIFGEYEGDISTVKELAESNLDWGADHPDWAKPLSGDDRAVYEKIREKFYVYNVSELQELFENHEDFAFAISPLESRMWTFRDYITPNHINHYKVMTDKLYRQFTYLPMRKHSMFLETFNIFLLNVRETGLFVRWEIMALMSYSHQYENIRALQTAKISTEVLLGLRHIKGILMLLVFGHLVAICIFIYELYTFKKNSSKN